MPPLSKYIKIYGGYLCLHQQKNGGSVVKNNILGVSKSTPHFLPPPHTHYKLAVRYIKLEATIHCPHQMAKRSRCMYLCLYVCSRLYSTAIATLQVGAISLPIIRRISLQILPSAYDSFFVILKRKGINLKTFLWILLFQKRARPRTSLWYRFCQKCFFFVIRGLIYYLNSP